MRIKQSTFISSLITKNRVMKGEGGVAVGGCRGSRWQSAGALSQRPWVQHLATPALNILRVRVLVHSP